MNIKCLYLHLLVIVCIMTFCLVISTRAKRISNQLHHDDDDNNDDFDEFDNFEVDESLKSQGEKKLKNNNNNNNNPPLSKQEKHLSNDFDELTSVEEEEDEFEEEKMSASKRKLAVEVLLIFLFEFWRHSKVDVRGFRGVGIVFVEKSDGS